MPYIIDGHNLIGKNPSMSLQEIDDETILIQTLQEFCQREQKKAEVYFDNAPPGVPRARVHGRVTAYFVRAGKTADEAIYERLKALKNEAKNWTVVSSDRQVQASAKSVHARVLSSEQFVHQLRQGKLTADKPSLETLPEDSIKEFEELFKNRHSPED